MNLKRIVSMLTIISMIFILLTGCSDKGQPTKALENLFRSYSGQDFEKTSEFIEGANKDFAKEMKEMLDEVQSSLLEKITDFTYTIKSETIEENTALIEVEMQINDVGTAMLQTAQEAFALAFSMAFSDADQADIDKLLEQKILDRLNSEIPKVTKNVKVNLVKKNNKWLVEVNDDLLNALTGNMAVLAEAFDEQSSFDEKESYSGEIYSIGQTVPIISKDNELLYEMTINNINLVDERNEYSDKNPAQVLLIDYTYKNVSSKEEIYVADHSF